MKMQHGRGGGRGECGGLYSGMAGCANELQEGRS